LFTYSLINTSVNGFQILGILAFLTGGAILTIDADLDILQG